MKLIAADGAERLVKQVYEEIIASRNLATAPNNWRAIADAT